MKSLKTAALWIILVGLFFMLLVYGQPRKTQPRPIEALKSQIELGRVTRVEINDQKILFQLVGSQSWYESIGALSNESFSKLQRAGVQPKIGESKSFNQDLIFYLLIFLGLVIGLIFFLRKMSANSGGMNLMQLSKSRAKLADDSKKTTFADVGGCAEAKESLGDVIDFLKAPDRWLKAGVRLPRGVLLEGPPGSGKTHIARAIAGETGSNFYVVAASEFVELFVGVGAARVRDMFETASKNAPSILFIDEIDAVGRRRGSGLGGSHDEREQTLNQLLVCMDGFQHDARVVVIGATNRPDILDKALLRPGRFDRRIKMDELSRADRVEILSIHTRNKSLAPELSLDLVADMTAGMHGADIEQLVNESGLLAVRRSMRNGTEAQLTVDDFRTALKPRQNQERRFDHVDAVLMDSVSQLTEPTGRAVMQIQLVDGTSVNGEVIWADAAFIKIRSEQHGEGVLVSKSQIVQLEAGSGTERASLDSISADHWGGQRSDTM